MITNHIYHQQDIILYILKGMFFVNTNDITVDWESGIKIPAVRYILDLDEVS